MKPLEILAIFGVGLLILVIGGAFGMNLQKNKPQRCWVAFKSINSKANDGMMFSDILRDGQMTFQVNDTSLKVSVHVETID